jgi:hypothetical protein
VSRDAGERDFDHGRREWVAVRWMIVLWFPPIDRPGAVETGWAMGADTRREAFAKLRRALREHGAPAAMFVPHLELVG